MTADTLCHYIDRDTGQRHQEIIYGESELTFLYGHPLGKRLRPLLVNNRYFSELHALPKKLWLSQKQIEPFVQRYDVNIDEAEFSPGHYPTLDAFFTRKLKPGLRPVCHDTQALVSPADGRALAYAIDEQLTLSIKGQSVPVATLLGNQQAARTLRGGTALVIRLAPKDYHRVHCPLDGTATPPKHIRGTLESVHPIALNAGANSFANKRTITTLTNGVFGPVYMINVGALTVGTIVHTCIKKQVKRGDELAYFRFGGSTVVLLWGKNGPAVDSDIWQYSRKGLETLIQYGSQIASINTNKALTT